MGVGGGRFAAFKKWVGVAAALLSFGSAVYGLVHAQADLRERKRVVAEQVAAGRAERAVGDYPAAWDSLQRASTMADADGVLAKLFGGLSGDRQTLRAAQEDLAMEWLRSAHAPEGHTFSEIADKLVTLLAVGATTASGARKADLLAHLGWAYFLKTRDGPTDVKPEGLYREAVAADATNPYANAFWGHLVLWNHGALSDASARFVAALSTGRARADVRRFQLAALWDLPSDDAHAAWLRVVDEMFEAGESLDAPEKHRLSSIYYFALSDADRMNLLLAAVPPAKQIALQRMLLQSSDVREDQKMTLTAAMALTLSAAGNTHDALTAWRDVLAATGAEPGSTLAPRAREAIRRITAQRANRE